MDKTEGFYKDFGFESYCGQDCFILAFLLLCGCYGINCRRGMNNCGNNTSLIQMFDLRLEEDKTISIIEETYGQVRAVNPFNKRAIPVQF